MGTIRGIAWCVAAVGLAALIGLRLFSLDMTMPRLLLTYWPVTLTVVAATAVLFSTERRGVL